VSYYYFLKEDSAPWSWLVRVTPAFGPVMEEGSVTFQCHTQFANEPKSFKLYCRTVEIFRSRPNTWDTM